MVNYLDLTNHKERRLFLCLISSVEKIHMEMRSHSQTITWN